MDNVDIATSLISAGVIVMLVPTIFFTVGNLVEKILVRKEMIRILKTLNMKCTNIQDFKKVATKKLEEGGNGFAILA
jgi:positive regulator of sigma E activity